MFYFLINSVIKKNKTYKPHCGDDSLRPSHGTNTGCSKDKYIKKEMTLDRNQHTQKKLNSLEYMPEILNGMLKSGLISYIIILTVICPEEN